MPCNQPYKFNCHGVNPIKFSSLCRGTGVRGLSRGLATQAKVDPGAFSGQRQGWKTHLVMHCFCVCSSSALLGDIVGGSRSMECDLSVLSIYPRIFLCIVSY